jgi:hypothetical protein
MIFLNKGVCFERVNLLPSSSGAAQGCAGSGDSAKRARRKCAALDLPILRKNILQNPVDSSFIKAHEVNRKLVASKNQNSLEVQLPFKNDFIEQGSLF